MYFFVNQFRGISLIHRRMILTSQRPIHIGYKMIIEKRKKEEFIEVPIPINR